MSIKSIIIVTVVLLLPFLALGHIDGEVVSDVVDKTEDKKDQLSADDRQENEEDLMQFPDDGGENNLAHSSHGNDGDNNWVAHESHGGDDAKVETWRGSQEEGEIRRQQGADVAGESPGRLTFEEQIAAKQITAQGPGIERPDGTYIFPDEKKELGRGPGIESADGTIIYPDKASVIGKGPPLISGDGSLIYPDKASVIGKGPPLTSADGTIIYPDGEAPNSAHEPAAHPEQVYSPGELGSPKEPFIGLGNINGPPAHLPGIYPPQPPHLHTQTPTLGNAAKKAEHTEPHLAQPHHPPTTTGHTKNLPIPGEKPVKLNAKQRRFEKRADKHAAWEQKSSTEKAERIAADAKKHKEMMEKKAAKAKASPPAKAPKKKKVTKKHGATPAKAKGTPAAAKGHNGAKAA